MFYFSGTGELKECAGEHPFKEMEEERDQPLCPFIFLDSAISEINKYDSMFDLVHKIILFCSYDNILEIQVSKSVISVIWTPDYILHHEQNMRLANEYHLSNIDPAGRSIPF